MPTPAVRVYPPAPVVVQFDGLRLQLDRDGDGFRVRLFAGSARQFFVMAFGDSIRLGRPSHPSAWVLPCLWLGTDFSIDMPEEALQAIEDWHANLPPRRKVMRLADQPEALPIENAEAIAAASAARHGAHDDVRC
jgi:hypothetical protein